MNILEGKVAIVTGAGRGIGRGEAIALAKEGARVVVLSRTYEDVATTAKLVEQASGQALPLVCDVQDRSQVAAAVAATVEAFGTVDILVNNAQVIYPGHPLEDWTEEEMRVSYESGLLGSWSFMVECFPYLKRRGGRVINTCSPTGHGVLPRFVGYAAAKEAIRALTRTAAREWGQYRINVNVISPAVWSDTALKFYSTDEARAAVLKEMGVVLPELGDAEQDIGRAVVFLSGPDSRTMTGCTLSLDGGCAML